MRGKFIILALLAVNSGCNWINPSEETPSYIRIDEFSFTSGSGEGTDHQNFTDAWVYVNGEKIGTYPLPCEFPVLNSGDAEIQVFPGIKLDGISATRSIYPFATSYTTSATLIKDSVTKINPASSYVTDLTFEVNEAFESGGISFSGTSYSDTNIYRTSDPGVFYEDGGTASGIISLTQERSIADIKSNDAFDLPTLGQYNFLELHFKTDVEVQVGLIANTGTQSVYHAVVVLNPTDTWKKIYINFTPLVTREYDASSFYVFFRAVLPDDMTSGNIYLDNIKLIHP